MLGFAFVSLGHHRRKGFWLAIEALALIRAEGFRNARFLVIGGLPATLTAIQERLERTVNDWREWITFTSQQSAVEHYLAAADAFLYPSYFEAFCLAEIEATALGLPLLLTPHHGTEMILRDGVNGLKISYDPREIAETLRTVLTEGTVKFTRDLGKALNPHRLCRATRGDLRTAADRSITAGAYRRGASPGSSRRLVSQLSPPRSEP